MAGATIDDLGNLMVDYLPDTVETLNNTVMLRKLMRNDYKWEGSNIEFHLHTARNHAAGYIEDAGALPVPDKEDFAKAEAFRRFLVGTVQISDGALATAASSRRASRDVATSHLRGMMETLAKIENYFGYRDGTGTVALLGTDVDGATWGATDGRMLWDGATLEVRDAADITTLHGTVTISSVARALDANGQVAVTSTAALPSGAAAGDFLVWSGSVNRAVTGLEALIDDGTSGTFQNINLATYPRYTSPVFSSAVDRPISPTLFRQVLATVRQESGQVPGRKVTCLTNLWESIEVEELYESQIRLKPDTKTVGLAVASFMSSLGRIEVVPDHDAPYNTMFFADFSQIFRAVQKNLDWRRNKNGGIFSKSQNSLVWRADALEICEYFIKQRNRCAKITDLSETMTTGY